MLWIYYNYTMYCTIYTIWIYSPYNIYWDSLETPVYLRGSILHLYKKILNIYIYIYMKEANREKGREDIDWPYDDRGWRKKDEDIYISIARMHIHWWGIGTQSFLLIPTGCIMGSRRGGVRDRNDFLRVYPVRRRYKTDASR